MVVSLRTVLRRPADAFDELSAKPSLLGPSLVVFAFGVVVAIQSVPLMAVALADAPAHSVRMATGNGLVAVASAAPFNLAVSVGIGFVAWFVLAAVTYAGARALGGTGTFRDTLATVAWVAAPLALCYGSIVAVAGVIAATADATLATVLGGHAFPYVPGRPPAYFDGRGLFDLRAWLFVAGVALAARAWVGAVPTVHGDGLRRSSAAVGALAVVLVALAALT